MPTLIRARPRSSDDVDTTANDTSTAAVLALFRPDRFISSQTFGRAELTDSVAAVSVGLVAGEALLDLDYEEDSAAEVDVNVVMAGDGRLIEVQATAERSPLDRPQLDELLDLAAAGIEDLQRFQEEAIAVPRE